MAAASGIRAGAAYVELFVKDNRFVKGLNVATARLKAFGASITALGGKLAGLGMTIAAPFLGAAKLFVGMGDDVAKMAARTGVAVEALSELRYAAQQSGASAEELEKGLRTMSRTIVEAARGSVQARRTLSRLGLTVATLTGLSPDQQFELIAERLSRIQNPANRATIALELFGRTGVNLVPMLSSGASGIQELRREANRLGLTMSTEDARAAEAFGDALSTLWQSLKRVAFVVGASLAPSLKRLAGWITRVAANLSGWIDKNRDVVLIIGAVIAVIVGLGGALLLLGPVISAVGAAFGVLTVAISAAAAAMGLLGAVIGFLLSPIGLVVTAVGGIAVAVLVASDDGNKALAALGQGFQQLRATATTTWKAIQDAIAAGDLAGAMEVAWLGLQVAWESGIAAISRSWRHFKSFFVELFWDAVYGVAYALHAGLSGIEITFWAVINALADGWDTFCTGLKIAFNDFVAFFRRAWARVRNLFDSDAAQREVDAINREVEQQNREALEQLDRNVRERDRNLDQLVEEADKREEVLLQMWDEEKRQRQREIEAANAADQERVAELQRALDKKAAELAKRREQMQEDRAPGGKGERRPVFDLRGLDEAVAKVDVRGTFNPFAVPGLGSESLAERTAIASEQVARNTGQLVRQAQNGGLVFA